MLDISFFLSSREIEEEEEEEEKRGCAELLWSQSTAADQVLNKPVLLYSLYVN
jgi:hypothetical protein